MGKLMSRQAADEAAVGQAAKATKPAGRNVLVALFWLACFAAPIAMLCLQAYLGDTYPFGSESFLAEDFRYQYIDFFTWYRNVLLGGGNLLYSFAQGLGSGTWGLFSYYLSSPFNLLIVLFDEAHLVDFGFWMTALKLGCIQVAMAFFLRRRFQLGHGWTWLFAMSFTLSSWVVTQMRNPLWLDALILLPIACWGCYRLIRTGRFVALGIIVALDIMICWYMAYISILFLCLYVLFELAAYVFEGNRVDARFVGGQALRYIVAMLIALGLSAWTFVPTILAMMGGSSSAALDRLFSCTPTELLLSVVPGGWQTSGVPQFYTGTVALVLAAGFVVNRRVPVGLRTTGVLFGLFMAASSVFAPLEYVWCGFRIPNGFYSRTAFLVSFLIVWLAAYSVRCGWEPMWKRTRKDGAGSSVTPRHLSLRRQPVAHSVLMVLIAVSAIELAGNAYALWPRIYTGYPQDVYDGYRAEAERQLDELNAFDNSYLRIDKTYTRVGAAALNEGIAEGFRQLSSYSSASNQRAIAFLNSVGYSSEGEFSTRYSTENLPMDALLGVGYASDYSQPVGYEDVGLTPTSSGARFYRNPYVLSLGSLVQDDVLDTDLSAYGNPFERQNAIFQSATGLGPLYEPLEAELVSDDSSSRSWRVTVPEACIGYLYVVTGADADSNQALALSIDGGPAVSEGWRFDHAVRALGGVSDGGESHAISLSTYSSPDGTAAPLPEGTSCLFYALNWDMFQAVMARLHEDSFEPVTLEDGLVEGTFTASEDGALLMSIPYEAGWMATVDGEEQELQPVFGGGMTALTVDAGKHEVKLSYMSPGLFTGTIVSCVSAAVLIVASLAVRFSGKSTGSLPRKDDSVSL